MKKIVVGVMVGLVAGAAVAGAVVALNKEEEVLELKKKCKDLANEIKDYAVVGVDVIKDKARTIKEGTKLSKEI